MWGCINWVEQLQRKYNIMVKHKSGHLVSASTSVWICKSLATGSSQDSKINVWFSKRRTFPLDCRNLLCSLELWHLKSTLDVLGQTQRFSRLGKSSLSFEPHKIKRLTYTTKWPEQSEQAIKFLSSFFHCASHALRLLGGIDLWLHLRRLSGLSRLLRGASPEVYRTTGTRHWAQHAFLLAPKASHAFQVHVSLHGPCWAIDW